MSTANKILMGASGAGGPVGPSDDEFNRTSFLSHFEGSNNGVNNVFDDSSASNHTVTANGNVTQGSFGPFARPDGEWAVTFDGVNDSYLTTPNSSDFAFGTGDFTVEFWFNPNHDDTGYILDSRGSGVNGFRLYRAGSSGGDLVFSTVGSGNSSTTVDVNTVNNNWYHFCATRASGVIKFFLNGSQVGSDVNDTSNITSTDLNIGAGYTGTLAYTGIISNLRIIKGTAVNPTGLPTSPATNVTNTVLLTCQSNRFVDNSSSGHTITPDGGVAVTAFGPFLTSSVYDPAVNGASGYFDGSDDLTIPTSSDFNLSTNPFTFSFWANFSAGGTVYGRYNYPSGQRETFIGCYDNGVITVRVSPDGTGYYTHSTASGVFVFNQWNYIVVTRTIDGSNSIFKTYVNGTLSKTSTFAMTTIYYASQSTYIMNYGPIAERPTGYLCDFKLVNGTATAPNSSNPTAPATNTTNTKLLLNMADGQAIDSAAQDNITLEGGAKLSTAQYKFGTSSILFNNAASCRASFKIKPFGTGDWTVEGFFRAIQFHDDNHAMWDTRPYQTANNGPVLVDESTPGLTREMYFYNGTKHFLGSASALSANTWYHIAVCRSGTSTKVFLDGTQVGSTISDSTDYVNETFTLGSYSYANITQGWDGYVDEFRISYMARYTSNFTAPSEPFPDKGQ